MPVTSQAENSLWRLKKKLEFAGSLETSGANTEGIRRAYLRSLLDTVCILDPQHLYNEVVV